MRMIRSAASASATTLHTTTWVRYVYSIKPNSLLTRQFVQTPDTILAMRFGTHSRLQVYRLVALLYTRWSTYITDHIRT